MKSAGELQPLPPQGTGQKMSFKETALRFRKLVSQVVVEQFLFDDLHFQMEIVIAKDTSVQSPHVVSRQDAQKIIAIRP